MELLPAYPHTRTQGVSCVSRGAGTDGSFLVATIVSRRTDGIRTTRVRVAQILLCKWPAADERITGHITRTAANRCQSAQITVRPNTAGSVAGILADTIDARGTSSRTIPITEALRTALAKRTTDVPLWTFANCSVASNAGTGGTLAALITPIHTFELAAVLSAAALDIRFALVSTSRQWRSL